MSEHAKRWRTGSRGSRWFRSTCWLSLVLGLATPVCAAEGWVARGKGFEIRQEEWDRVSIEQKVALESRSQPLTPAQEALLEKQLLDRLIINRVLQTRATAEDRARGKANAEKSLATQRQRAGSEEAFRRQVLAAGSTVELVSARLVEQAIAEAVIEREVRSRVRVTEAQIREFYEAGIDVNGREVRDVIARLETTGRETVFYSDATNRLATIVKANRERLERPERARARLIVLFTMDLQTGAVLPESVRQEKRTRMEAIRRRLVGGEDFKQVAQEVSEEPDVKTSGGEYVATRPQVTLPELAEALFALPLKQLSPIVTTKAGLYLVEVLERFPAGKVTWEEAQPEIRGMLEEQETQKQLPAWFEQLRKEYGVEIAPAFRTPLEAGKAP